MFDYRCRGTNKNARDNDSVIAGKLKERELTSETKTQTHSAALAVLAPLEGLPVHRIAALVRRAHQDRRPGRVRIRGHRRGDLDS